jgi:Protein of unknown function (DUF1344)
MIKTAVALSALLAVGSAGAVLAQEQIAPPAISGTIESVDPATRSVVLDDGQTYMLGESTDVGSLQAGSRVDLSCDTNGTNCTVVSSDMQNGVSPESGTEPSAGSNEDGGGAGSEDETVPPGNTTPPDGGSMDGGAGNSGGSN